MGVIDTIKRLNGCTGGLVVYEAAKRLTQADNVSAKVRHLKPTTICRLQPLFPNLKLSKVEFCINANMPSRWYTSNFEAIKFGYRIY